MSYLLQVGEAQLRKAPKDQYVVGGGTVVFPCAIRRVRLGKGEVSWNYQVKGVVGRQNISSGALLYPSLAVDRRMRYSIIGNSSRGEYHLQITNIRESDQATYECVYHEVHADPALVITRRRDGILTIGRPPDPGYPLCTMTPSVGVMPLMNITVTCTTLGGAPRGKVRWYNGKRWLTRWGANGVVKYTRFLTANDVGITLSCEENHPSRPRYPRKCQVNPLKAIQVEVSPGPEVSVKTGNNMIFSCRKTKGKGAVGYTWSMNAQPIVRSEHMFTFGNSFEKLRVIGVRRDMHNAKITCQATDANGYTTFADSVLSVVDNVAPTIPPTVAPTVPAVRPPVRPPGQPRPNPRPNPPPSPVPEPNPRPVPPKNPRPVPPKNPRPVPPNNPRPVPPSNPRPVPPQNPRPVPPQNPRPVPPQNPRPVPPQNPRPVPPQNPRPVPPQNPVPPQTPRPVPPKNPRPVPPQNPRPVPPQNPRPVPPQNPRPVPSQNPVPPQNPGGNNPQNPHSPFQPNDPAHRPNTPQNPNNPGIPNQPQNPANRPHQPQNPTNRPYQPQNPANRPNQPQNPANPPNQPQNPVIPGNQPGTNQPQNPNLPNPNVPGNRPVQPQTPANPKQPQKPSFQPRKDPSQPGRPLDPRNPHLNSPYNPNPAGPDVPVGPAYGDPNYNAPPMTTDAMDPRIGAPSANSMAGTIVGAAVAGLVIGVIIALVALYTRRNNRSRGGDGSTVKYQNHSGSPW